VLSALLDPEEYRVVVRAYHETCAGIITRYAGHTAQHLGDGLLVYFGYPAAHEDDAQRAVRTGLEIIAGLQTLKAQLQPAIKARLPHPIQVRIGIHTGLVVIGEIGSNEKREILALGETPNLAARIQGTANPDEVMISAATYHLVEGLFACEDRGQPDLKGVATPLTLYRVVKESDAQSRFQVVVRKGLTPLIGREHELGLLRERWERVRDGEGQVVLLSGEPGIGKSRLVETLKDSLKHEGVSCLELHCSPYHQNSALYPVIEHVQRVLGFQRDDSPEEKLRKLEVGARRAVPLQPDAIPLLAALLSLPHPAGYAPLSLSPQRQKEKTHAALVSWLCAEAKQQAVVYAWEDLHWADPSTLELLTLFLQQVPTTRLLAVLTFRPEFISPWGSHSYLSQLTLSRLGRSHVETMVEKVTGGRALPKEVVQQIVSKTDGVPLFVEELTKSVIESVGSMESVESSGAEGKLGQSSLQLGIPATLQDALMARLDRLGSTKEVAQLGATLGREFDYALLQAVSPLNEEGLQQNLRQLVETELVFQSGVPPQARYLFKHALVQDTAYQSLLKSRRQQLHHQVVHVLVKKFPQTIETQPEVIAHHYTEAGSIEQAIPYWQKAGERASQRSANVEALQQLTKGLELLKTLSDAPERAQQELTLQLGLGAVLIAVKGFAALEVEKTYTRARELCQQLGETPRLVPVLGSLVVFYSNRGEVRTARELAERLMRLAQSIQDPYLLSRAHGVLAWTLQFLGELTSARTHVEQGIALDDSQTHPRPTINTDNPRMICLSFAGRILWHLGYPDQALKRSQEAITLAEELSHPFSLASTLGNAAPSHLLRREEQLARERAEALITLSTEQGFPYWVAGGTIVRGWALTEQGQVEEGIAQMQQGLAAFRNMGVEVGRPRWLALLAEAHGKVGQVEEGLTTLAEALAAVDKTGERVSEAELYRLKGELVLQSTVHSPQSEIPNTQHPTPSTQSEAEACFLKAIEIARKQQAKSLELRATTSLARLWQQQGKKVEAHKLLADVYNWFTEGFDTKDLQEAKALLEELT
jgi:class 3 adenylate cyclase/predicted ATPase